MSDIPPAKLVRTIQYGRRTTYVFSCVDCGREFTREANNRRINPYCGPCMRNYEKIKNKEKQEKRQEEHDKKVRVDLLEECIRELVYSELMTFNDCIIYLENKKEEVENG